MVDGLWLMVNG